MSKYRNCNLFCKNLDRHYKISPMFIWDNKGGTKCTLRTNTNRIALVIKTYQNKKWILHHSKIVHNLEHILLSLKGLICSRKYKQTVELFITQVKPIYILKVKYFVSMYGQAKIHKSHLE